MKARYIAVFVFVVVLLCVAPVGVYMYFMLFEYGVDQVSRDNADWGAFGSYLGGILSPLFTLLSIAFIYYSVRENNSNHKTEMQYLSNQQTISMVGALADAFNSKLDSGINLGHPLIADTDINIYESILCGPDVEGEETDRFGNSESSEITKSQEAQEAQEVAEETPTDDSAESDAGQNASEADEYVFRVGKSPLKLSEILESYMFYSDSKRMFNWQYVNFVNVTTYDLFETLKVAFAYSGAIGDHDQRKQAVMLFDAKTNSMMITAILHSLAHRVEYASSAVAEIRSLESFFADVALLSNVSDGYKYSSVPFMKLLLRELVVSCFRSRERRKLFDFDRDNEVVVRAGESHGRFLAKKILEEDFFAVGGVDIRLGSLLRNPFGVEIEVDYDLHQKFYLIEVQPKDVLGIHARFGIKTPCYVLTVSMDGLIFKLVELEFKN